jgi:uncharacterized protein (DUF486 family)
LTAASGVMARVAPIALLVLSNVFMTFAWYGHLRYRDRALWLVIVASWGIAFFEYCLAVPANRWGSGVYSAPELKAIQEVVTLSVFAIFSFFYLGQRMNLDARLGLCADCRRGLLRLSRQRISRRLVCG